VEAWGSSLNKSWRLPSRENNSTQDSFYLRVKLPLHKNEREDFHQ
jgi:hypothetical protein